MTWRTPVNFRRTYNFFILLVFLYSILRLNYSRLNCLWMSKIVASLYHNHKLLHLQYERKQGGRTKNKWIKITANIFCCDRHNKIGTRLFLFNTLPFYLFPLNSHFTAIICCTVGNCKTWEQYYMQSGNNLNQKLNLVSLTIYDKSSIQ